MALELQARAEACGKVILLGEHSVVYGYPALAAGIERSLVLHATRLADEGAPLELAIPAWDLDLRLTADSDHLVVRACLEVLGHCDGPVTGWRIEGESGVPARAGLGSSAALGVALARLALGPQFDGQPPVEAVIAASLAGERVFHGTPSGIDSEVAARGGVLAFRRGEPVEPVRLGRSLHLVVLPSGIPRQTGALVAGVRARRERWPAVVDPVLAALGQLVAAGRRSLELGELPAFAELCTVAHELLGALGVGRPALDALCAAAVAEGALAAKLTGAGGGGCAVALCGHPDERAEVLTKLRARWAELAARPELGPFAVDVDPVEPREPVQP